MLPHTTEGSFDIRAEGPVTTSSTARLMQQSHGLEGCVLQVLSRVTGRPDVTPLRICCPFRRSDAEVWTGLTACLGGYLQAGLFWNTPSGSLEHPERGSRKTFRQRRALRAQFCIIVARAMFICQM